MVGFNSCFANIEIIFLIDIIQVKEENRLCIVNVEVIHHKKEFSNMSQSDILFL